MANMHKEVLLRGRKKPFLHKYLEFVKNSFWVNKVVFSFVLSQVT